MSNNNNSYNNSSIKISKKIILDKLLAAGLSVKDIRVKRIEKLFSGYASDKLILIKDLKNITKPDRLLINKALDNNFVIHDFKKLCNEVCKIYEQLKNNTLGDVACYIPELAKVNPDDFAISICTVDGQQFSIGDDNVLFSAQSTCKPINYCLALSENGEQFVHEYIGREPSGHGFNEITLDSKNRPHNPMINAGAIMACSLIQAKSSSSARFEYVSNQWKELSGDMKVGFNNSIYLSERDHADRNFALAYFMKDQGSFCTDVDLQSVLNFYFQCCSIEMNSNTQASVAATLANSGVCPLSNKRLLAADVVRNCLSLMFSCGMYDYSGEFAFKVGLPAKSAVSGSLMLVVPNVMGICIYSPRLDKLGNSVRGVKFCKRLVQTYNLHNFDDILNSGDKQDPRKY